MLVGGFKLKGQVFQWTESTALDEYVLFLPLEVCNGSVFVVLEHRKVVKKVEKSIDFIDF